MSMNDVSSAIGSNCPCGSGRSYEACCRIVHADHGRALLPEELLRARYTAYVLGKDDFLLRSWDYATRPAAIDLSAPIRWLQLLIAEAQPVNGQSRSAEIRYTALFIEQKRLVELTERATFVRRAGLWYYADGTANAQTFKLAAQTPCPCGSGRKFKRCCQSRS